jgi:multicomponent Na+:H+ antiporter subunit D
VPAVGRDGAPLVSAFLFSAAGGTVWFLLLDYLQTYPWLSESPQWASVLTTLGVVTAAVGGLLGTVRWSPGRLMGYLVMVDTGMTLVALGQSSRTGVDLSVGMVFARAWGTALMASGLAGLRARTQGMDQAMTGLGQRAPWSTAALVVGGLSLAGFPLTAGFGSRWGLYRVLARSQPLVALLLLLITGGPLVGLLRMLRQLLSQPPTITSLEEEQQEEEPPPELPEPTVVVVLQILLIMATLGLGLLPQVLTTSAARVGASFTFFGP